MVYIISLSITSTSLQQLSRLSLSTPKPMGSLSRVTLGLLWVTDANHTLQWIKRQESRVMLWCGRVTSRVWGAHWLSSVFLNLGLACGSTLPTTAPVIGADLYMQRRSRTGPQGPTAVGNQGVGSQVGEQLAGPVRRGTQGWLTPALTICLNTFPGQHASNKQHYVKTKQYTLACPSSDHAAIYSQVKKQQ